MATSSSIKNKKKSEGLCQLKKLSKKQALGEIVEHVSLHDMHVDMYVMAYFVLYFEKRLPCVTSLEMWNCEMKDQYVNDIFAVLKHNETVKELGLSYNRFSATSPQIVDTLHTNSTIQKLDLSTNIIGTEGLINLARGIKKSWSLCWLDISENNKIVNFEVFIAFCLAVTQSSIEYLNLSSLFNKKNSTECVQIICKLFGSKVNKLLLNNNNINDEGAKLIAHALKDNPTLTSLSLDGNNITDDGARHLISVADEYDIELDIGRNSLSSDLQEAVDNKWRFTLRKRQRKE